MSVLLEIESITIVIPWNTVPAHWLIPNSLKFIGLPFLSTSFAWSPWICITALEWDMSVIAKSVSLRLFWTVSFAFSLLDKINQVLGALHKILVSLFDFTLELCVGISKPSIFISLILIFGLILLIMIGL